MRLSIVLTASLLAGCVQTGTYPSVYIPPAPAYGYQPALVPPIQQTVRCTTSYNGWSKQLMTTCR
jgi:hypothetical protein